MVGGLSVKEGPMQFLTRAWDWLSFLILGLAIVVFLVSLIDVTQDQSLRIAEFFGN